MTGEIRASKAWSVKTLLITLLVVLGEVLYKELPDTSERGVVRGESGYERNGRGTDLAHALLLNIFSFSWEPSAASSSR